MPGKNRGTKKMGGYKKSNPLKKKNRGSKKK